MSLRPDADTYRADRALASLPVLVPIIAQTFDDFHTIVRRCCDSVLHHVYQMSTKKGGKTLGRKGLRNGFKNMSTKCLPGARFRAEKCTFLTLFLEFLIFFEAPGAL